MKWKLLKSRGFHVRVHIFAQIVTFHRNVMAVKAWFRLVNVEIPIIIELMRNMTSIQTWFHK